MAEAASAAEVAARRLGQSGPVALLRSGTNHVFRVDRVVLRITPPDVDAASQVVLARWLSEQGIPAPMPLSDPELIGGVCVAARPHIGRHPPIDYPPLR